MATGLAEARHALKLDRIRQAWGLRKVGIQPRLIASALGVSQKQVSLYLHATVQELEEAFGMFRQLHLARLDDVISVLAERVKKGELGAIGMTLRAIQLQAQIAGTLAPVQIDVHETRTYVAEWGETLPPPTSAPAQIELQPNGNGQYGANGHGNGHAG